MEISEGNLTFHFPTECTAIKFDESQFYRKYFNALTYSKGVDIISVSPDAVTLIEIKDFSGHESENQNRLKTDYIHYANGQYEESLDIEVSLKTAMTIACLYGAFSESKKCNAANELIAYYDALKSEKIPNCNKAINIVLFMEGDFKIQSRPKKVIMTHLQHSINNKLKWLNCKVYVVDSSSYSKRLFQVN